LLGDTALPALMRYIFLLAPLLSSLSAFRMYLIAAGSAVSSFAELAAEVESVDAGEAAFLRLEGGLGIIPPLQFISIC
jgi:hypothetical protein